MITPTTELQPRTPERSGEQPAEIRFDKLDPATVERLRVLSELPVADLAAVGSVRQEVINRLLEGQDPDTAASIEQRLARDLETARGLQQQFLETSQQLQAANETPPASEPTVPVEAIPSVDGVVPPSPTKEADGAAGDDEEVEELTAAETAPVAAALAAEKLDPYAERNAAAQGLLDQLKQDDYSVPGQSNLALLKQVREVILRHNNEPLAVRYDTDGNVVIGVPEDGGDGLRTRLVTISHNETGTIEWLQRARPQDYLTLQRHRIAVIEDPQLQHDQQSKALAA